MSYFVEVEGEENGRVVGVWLTFFWQRFEGEFLESWGCRFVIVILDGFDSNLCFVIFCVLKCVFLCLDPFLSFPPLRPGRTSRFSPFAPSPPLPQLYSF